MRKKYCWHGENASYVGELWRQTYMHTYINLKLDVYLPIFVCSTNTSSGSGAVLTFCYVNLLLFIRVLWYWPYYYTCCKDKEIGCFIKWRPKLTHLTVDPVFLRNCSTLLTCPWVQTSALCDSAWFLPCFPENKT